MPRPEFDEARIHGAVRVNGRGPMAARWIVQASFWACAAAVLYLALTPNPVVSISDWDKANHVFAFFTLGSLGMTGWPGKRNAMLICLFVYGCMIEVLQTFTPTRQGDWHDVVADVVGLLIAAAIFAAFTWADRRLRK